MPVSRSEWFRIAFTAGLTWLLQRLWNRLLQRKKQIADQQNWDARVDLDTIQACLFSTVNLESTGRVEKQTILAKKLSDVFSNEYVRSLVLEAASKTTEENPFIVSFLRKEDRWNVLVQAMNHISSIFGPYHLFSNVASSYESCWYVFTLVGFRTRTTSRLFTNRRDGSKVQDDAGVLRIRLVVVEEQELRRICVGDVAISAEDLFSQRHRARWNIVQHLAEMFEKQIFRVSQLSDNITGPFDIRTQSWGCNLCGTLKKNSKLAPAVQEQNDDHEVDEPQLNCFLRIHVPVPLLTNTNTVGPEDCVLYE